MCGASFNAPIVTGSYAQGPFAQSINGNVSDIHGLVDPGVLYPYVFVAGSKAARKFHLSEAERGQSRLGAILRTILPTDNHEVAGVHARDACGDNVTPLTGQLPHLRKGTMPLPGGTDSVYKTVRSVRAALRLHKR